MEKKQVTRERLEKILGKFIKDSRKTMGDRNIVRLPIKLDNWCSGSWKDSKWSHTDVTIGDDVYTFTDKEINDFQFINMLQRAICDNAILGRVNFDVSGDGYWVSKTYYYKSVEIFKNPCKEFATLWNYLSKYGKGFTLGNFDVFHCEVCGKRNSWSDGKHDYLCYDAKECKKILDIIRKFKGSKDTLKVSVKEYFDYGDEGDYRCAQYQESEWYGHRGQMLCVEVTTPSGKVKLNKEFYW